MPLKRIDTLISDTDFPADQAALLTDLGIDVHLV
jgi:hypothetical protein